MRRTASWLVLGALTWFLLVAAPQAAVADELDATCAAIEDIAVSDPTEALAVIDRLRSPATNYVASGEPIPADLVPLLLVCETQRLTAIEADATANEVSATERAAARWSSFVSHWITPLGTMALTAAVSVVALAIAARFTSLIPGVRNGIRLSAWRKLAGSVGAVAIVGASLGFAYTISVVSEPLAVSDGEWALVVFWMILAAAGVLLLGLALASRLKISLEVRGIDGKRDELASARAAGVLSELGGSPAQGIYKPEGSDIEALANAIPEVGGTNWSGVVRSVTRFLFLGTPWRVIVDTDFERFAVVSIFHNGAQATVQRIDMSSASTSDDPVRVIDAYSAAIVVITLSRFRDGFEGLSGATNWASVGQYFLASRFEETDPRFLRLARAAVQKDPRNYVARFALQSAEAVSDAEYAEWLRDELGAIRKLPRGGQPLEVELRARRSLGVTEINLHSEGQLSDPSSIEAMASNVLELASRLLTAEARRTVLHQLLRSDTAILIRDLQRIVVDTELQRRLSDAANRSESWFSDAKASLYPDVAYNLACHYALQGDRNSAFRHLRIAMVDPDLREQARDDEEFDSIRADSEFRAVVSDLARTRFWDIEYFAPFETRLKECGLHTPGDLKSIGGLQDIRAYLGMEKAPFRKLATACDLAQRARDATSRIEVQSLEVELVASLFASGIYRAEDIPESWISSEGELEKVVNRACARFGTELPLNTAAEWVKAVRRNKAAASSVST